MSLAGLVKSVAKRWVRPVVIPPVRFVVRYAPGVARRFAWRNVVAPFLQYAEHDFIATTRFGTILAGNTLDLVQRCVFYFGEWEPNVSRYVADRLRPGDVFVDVGANIGYYSLLASTIVGPSGKVVAIEASPAIHGLLVDNLRRNRADNVEARSSLDALLQPGLLEEVRLVKIHVEGADWPVIRGMREALRRARADLEIVVELSPRALRAQGTTAEEVLAVFAAARFHPYRIENDNSAGHDMDVADARPQRLTAPISAHTEVVFSRRDAAFL
jgi:Protein-L-isoaspartate(D-aspartate) O-methyltransferase (PCMT)